MTHELHAAYAANSHVDVKAIPLVKGLPFIGSLLPLYRNPLEFLRRTHEQYGEVFSVQMGRHMVAVLAGVAANRFAGEAGKDYFSSETIWRDSFVEMKCPHALIGSDGERHQYQRNLMRPRGPSKRRPMWPSSCGDS